MRQEDPGANVIIGPQTAYIFKMQSPNEGVINPTAYRPLLDFPCGCRHCRQRKAEPIVRRTSGLAAIDVYDLPDDVMTSDYFH